MSRKIIGLDIREDAISAIVIRSGFKGNWIEDYTYVPIVKQLMDKPVETDDEEADESDAEMALSDVALFNAMETLCERINTEGAVCVASFPANQASYRNIQLPFKDSKKIRQILPLELEPILPFPIEAQIIDFQIISDHKKETEFRSNTTDVLIAAADMPRLRAYLDILAAFKLEPETITIGGYSTVLNLIRFANLPEDWLFADVDQGKCTLFVVSKEEISLIRSFPIQSGAEDQIKSLCTNIQHTLTAFGELSSSEFYPSEIRISGYNSTYPFEILEKQLSDSLDIPVRQADIARDANVRRVRAEHAPATHMNNPLSLALTEAEGIEGLNFRRGPFAPRQQWAEHKGSLIRSAILVILVGMVIFGNLMIDTYSMEKQIAELDNQIRRIFKTTFPEITRIVDPLHQMRVAMEDMKKTDLFPGETEKNIKVVDILSDMSRLIPKEIDVEITQSLITPENIQIAGNTDTFNAVDDIQNHLEKSTLFKKVTISSTNKERSGNRIQFKIRIQL